VIKGVPKQGRGFVRKRKNTGGEITRSAAQISVEVELSGETWDTQRSGRKDKREPARKQGRKGQMRFFTYFQKR